MTKYRDGTESTGSEAIAKCCPLCRGELVTRWFGVTAHSRRGDRARAFPLRVCAACKIAVQVRTLPRRKSLHPTRKAARSSVASEIAAGERRRTEMLMRRRPF
jgi:hypothetical protein